ncbi:MAG TPA: tail fiber assembly protein [Arsenophonus sp.]
MQNVTDVIIPLQDAVDLDMATEEEKQKLTEWRKYRVLFNRTDTSTAPEIDWPKTPK